MRNVRKQIKRNRKSRRMRRKDWASYDVDDLDAWDDIDHELQERVMPRGERERREALMDKVLRELEERDKEEPAGDPDMPGVQGTVIEVSGGLARVDIGGHQVLCSVRGTLTAEDTGYTNVVAVGDQVIVQEAEEDEGVVEQVLPRRSILARPDVFYSHLQQVIVANADQVLIVSSWREPMIWLELIDRYLIAAQIHKLAPVICVNKTDLAKDMEACRAELAPYEALGHKVLFTSAVSGEGVDTLGEVLRGKTTVLAGLSGVGKSSLLAQVQPGLEIRIGEVSDAWHEGRHTTSQVNMIPLEIGGFVVDTPGIREFGLSGLHRDDLALYYPEFARVAGSCRFGDCTHTQEPGCAVKSAVEGGRIPASRYHNYRRILSTLPA